MSTMNLTLLTDFYELTMMQGYFKTQNTEKVVFDAFYRKNPCDGGYAIAAGLDQVIDYIKNLRFSKEDIPVLLSIGKENLYVWEKRPGILHEDEAAALLYKAAAGRNIHGTEPKEGKIELIADCDGVLKINGEKLRAVNALGEMMIASRHGNFPVKKGDKIAGTRVIPLVIEEEKMNRAKEVSTCNTNQKYADI